MEGIPKFLPYDQENEYYMAIDHDWTVQQDYTKQYTVSVDSHKYDDSKLEQKPVVRGARHVMKNKFV